MKTFILGIVMAIALLVSGGPAEAKVAAVYASGHGGVQSAAERDPGLGFMLGARLLIFDGYVDYTGFGMDSSVSRGILGLRGGFGSREARLVLRAGAGAIREHGGALTGPTGAPDRTGGVVRAGVAAEAVVSPMLYLGFGIDGETYFMPANAAGSATRGSDVFASLHLTFELGI